MKRHITAILGALITIGCADEPAPGPAPSGDQSDQAGDALANLCLGLQFVPGEDVTGTIEQAVCDSLGEVECQKRVALCIGAGEVVHATRLLSDVSTPCSDQPASCRTRVFFYSDDEPADPLAAVSAMIVVAGIDLTAQDTSIDLDVATSDPTVGSLVEVAGASVGDLVAAGATFHRLDIHRQSGEAQGETFEDYLLAHIPERRLALVVSRIAGD